METTDAKFAEAFEIRKVALAAAAWKVRERARLIGKTAVGCAVLTEEFDVFTGCNVEHKYRCHDVHAEVNALTSMVAQADERAIIVVIAADRESFTPCGSCMDWIFELGGPGTIVAFQGKPDGPITSYTAADLMPHYPT